MALLTPLLEQNEQVHADIKTENELSLYLEMAQQEFSNISKYPVLSQEQAKQQIDSIFQAQGIKTNIFNKSNVANIKKISFVRLLDTLKQLKTQDGIVVIKATIERVGPGIVNAELTFSNLTQ